MHVYLWIDSSREGSRGRERRRRLEINKIERQKRRDRLIGRGKGREKRKR